MDKYMEMNTRPSPLDIARRTGRRVFFEDYSGTIRQAPQNYCLAIRRPDGTWFAAPDKASPINAHSLAIAIEQAETQDGQQLADAIEVAFWGRLGLVARLHNNDCEVRVDLGNTGRNWPNCGEQHQPGFPWLSFGRQAWDAAERWAREHGATEIIKTGRGA